MKCQEILMKLEESQEKVRKSYQLYQSILWRSIVELYQCQISFIAFEMQACNLECEHAICNLNMSIKTADLEDLLSNKNQFKSTEIVIKCDV